MSQFTTGLVNGVSIGAVFALIALGYTMIYGIVKMINFAHGEFIVVGGFTMYGMNKLLVSKVPLWANATISIITAIVACVVVVLITERLAYRPLRKRDNNRINPLITAIGVSYILYGIFNLIQSSQLKPPAFFPFLETRVDKMIFLLAVTTLCLVLLTLFYQKTKLGIATRAVSENADAAKLMGINNDFTIALTFALAAIMAAISALLFYTYNDTGMKFSDGTLLIGLIPFAAAVVGGIGSLPGAVVGGFIIGMVQEMAAAFGLSKWQVLFIYGILVLVLLLKPSGIFGRNEGEKV